MFLKSTRQTRKQKIAGKAAIVSMWQSQNIQ
jgi:hypothetical protein